MTESYPPRLVDATADEMFAVLMDMHRQQCRWDAELARELELTQDDTIAEWRRACNLLPCDRLPDAMNEVFEVRITRVEWQAVLEPVQTKRLRGVCKLLARHVRLPRVRPALFLGSTCMAAGAFLTVKSLLAEAGVDVSDIAPSTPLKEYTRRHTPVFLGPVSRLAPGALPPVTIRRPLFDVCLLGIVAAWIGMVIAVCAGSLKMGMSSALLFAICYGAGAALMWYTLPASVEFEGVRTFRDLSETIARYPRDVRA